MALTTGKTLHDRYRIVKLLGQGGFGAVYRAWDTNLNGPCAIKENFDTSQAAQQQFAREASLLYNLRHPNLPRVTDHFSIPDQGQYLVMDYIDGEDLQEMLDHAGGPMSEVQVLPWIVQICDALSYLHRQNPPVIHRDIKPANIRINKEGQAMLVDFGIAKIYDPKMRTTLGARAVTPGFSPPEQYGQGNTDAQSDIYALGATLYALLTGLTLPDSIDILTRHAAPLSPANLVNPNVSLNISAAIQRAMQLDKADRYSSMAEFKGALQARPELAYPSTPPVVAAGALPAETFKVPSLPISEPAGPLHSTPPRSAPRAAVPASTSRKKNSSTVIILAVLFLSLLICGGGGLFVYSQWGNWFPIATAETLLDTRTPEAENLTSSATPEALSFVTQAPTDTAQLETKPESAPPTSEPDAGAVNVLTMYYSYGNDTAEGIALLAVIKSAQEKYSNLTIKPQHVEFAEIFDRYMNNVTAGGGPDLLVAPDDSLGDMARNKTVLDVTDYVSGMLSEFSSAAIEGMTVDGRLYGLPESAKVVALYYNKSMLPQPPTNMNELTKLVAAGYGLVSYLHPYYLFGWAGAYGGQVLDSEGRCIADQGGWSEALAYLLELQKLGAIFDPEYNSAEQLFLSGKAAMIVNGSWVLEDYRVQLGDNLGVVRLPDGPFTPSPLLGVDGFFINPNSKNVKQAIELALYLTSQPSATIFTEKAGHIPVRLDVFPSDPLLQAFAEAAIFGSPRPQVPEFTNYWGPFQEMFTSVLRNGAPPDAALQKACAVMNEYNKK